MRLTLDHIPPVARNAAELSYISRFHRIIIAKLEHANYIRAAAYASSAADWNVILLVDPGIPDCRKKLNDALSSPIDIPDQNSVMAVKALLVPQETTTSASISIPHVWLLDDEVELAKVYSHPEEQTFQETEHIKFDAPMPGTLDHVSEGSLTSCFRRWVTDSGTRAPPWELFETNYIFCTRPAQILFDTLQLHWTEGKVLKRIILSKAFPASGASSLLRMVAYKEHVQGTLVLWVDSIRAQSKTSDLAQVLQKAFTKNHVLVCTDELEAEEREMLLKALQHAIGINTRNNSTTSFKIIWLDLRAATLDLWSKSSPKSSVVSPFVAPEDADGLASCLSRAFPEHKEALQIVASLAKDHKEQPESHMLAFVLAASQGVSKSITSWVAEIHDDLKQRVPALYCVALAFAFASAFAPTRSARYRCISDAPILAISLDALGDGVFRQLFPPDYAPPPRVSTYVPPSLTMTSSCLHPFLARLFLSHSYELHWNNFWLEWTPLCAAWNNCVQVFKPHEQCHSTLQSLVSDRNNTLFSPFIIECVSALTAKKNMGDTLTIISKSVLAPTRNILSFHSHIIESRLARYAATQASKMKARTKFMGYAITSARRALRRARNTNAGDMFMVKQNLAVMLGVARALCPDTYVNEDEEANELLMELYASAQPCKMDDIVAMGIQWAGRFSDGWKTKLPQCSPNTTPPTTSTPSTIVPFDVQLNGWEFDPLNERYWIFSDLQRDML